MATIRIDTVLDAPLDTVWDALQSPATFVAVSAPVLRFRGIDPLELPARWQPGESLVAMRLFGLVPLGRQVISISFEETDGPRRVMRDNGRGGLAHRWDHRITIAQRPDGRTDYTDEITIEAGPLTPLVTLFARVFYAHRQRRWHRLLASGALPPGEERPAP